MSASLEHDIQAAYFDWVRIKANGDERYRNIAAIPNGGKRSFGAAMYYKREGMEPGLPDILIAWPSGKYHGMFIETKRQGQRLRDTQKTWQERLLRAGYLAMVCFSFEGMRSATERYFNGEIVT